VTSSWKRKGGRGNKVLIRNVMLLIRLQQTSHPAKCLALFSSIEADGKIEYDRLVVIAIQENEAIANQRKEIHNTEGCRRKTDIVRKVHSRIYFDDVARKEYMRNGVRQTNQNDGDEIRSIHDDFVCDKVSEKTASDNTMHSDRPQHLRTTPGGKVGQPSGRHPKSYDSTQLQDGRGDHETGFRPCDLGLPKDIDQASFHRKGSPGRQKCKMAPECSVGG